MVEGEVIIGCEAPEDIKHDRMHFDEHYRLC